MNKLWIRLSISFSVVVLVGAAIIMMLGLILNNRGFRESFIREDVLEKGGLIHILETAYQQNQSWAEATLILNGARSMMPFGGLNSEISIILMDTAGQVLYHPQAEQVGQHLEVNTLNPVPLHLNDEVIGYLVISEENSDNRHGPVGFLERFSRAYLYIALIGGLAGLIFGIVTSRSLTAPLSRLAQAAQAIGQGDFSRQMEVVGSDEMQEVATAFNDMVQALQEAETLRSNLVADVAHELRTPLSVLQGNLRAILDGVYPLETSEIARLYDQTRLLSRLVNDLHELAQAEAGQLPLSLQQTDIARLLDDIVTTFGPLAETESISLSAEVASALPPLQVDQARISQVLHNLLGNALRHTPAQGRITLRAGQSDEQVWIAIQDTGEGILAIDLPYVFERFYRADRARARSSGGSGLGLAIAKAIIEEHGGRVTAESRGVVGEGSCFTVYLPRNLPAP